MLKKIAIFGGGPASLALASFLNPHIFDITIYEQNKSCGRKFLVAGKGGFNLSHSESIDQFKRKYIPSHFLENALNYFSNNDLRRWLWDLGIDTFVGSSGRIFPVKGIKPIEVLNAILSHLESRNVKIKHQVKWEGWSSNGLPIVNDNTEVVADYYVYAFGGASWKVTGSTGAWLSKFEQRGIGITNFEPSNCAFQVKWSPTLLELIEGKPLKNIAVRCGDQMRKGELVITRFGLEGNAIYALSDNIRKGLSTDGSIKIYLDFKPMFSFDKIKAKMLKSKSRSRTEFLKQDLKLSKVQIQLIKNLTSKSDFKVEDRLIENIKKMPLDIVGLAPLDEAISTVGGILVEELNDFFELKKMKDSFCIGEMVDWDVPTGGYLLQGCFSMGAYLASHINEISKL